MFKELAPIVATGTNLCIMLTGAPDGQLMVTILPQTKDGQSAALATPLSVTATPDELDAELPAVLTSYVSHRTTLAETLDNVKTIMEAAGKTAMDAATKSVGKGGVTTAPAELEGEQRDDDLESERVAAPVRSSISKASVAKPKDDTSDLDLF